MDYKYIEQLLERYWDCQTTLEEERILRSFFSQDDVPAQLLQYKSLFDIQAEDSEEGLGEEFDEKMLRMVGQEKTVTLVRLTFRQRIMPLIKAVAVVAVIITIGNMLEEAVIGKPSGTPVANTYVKTNEVDSTFTVKDEKKTASADSTSMKMPSKTSME